MNTISARTILKSIYKSPLFWPVVAFILTFGIGFALLAGGVLVVNNDESVPSAAHTTLPTQLIEFTNKYDQQEHLTVELAVTPAEWETGLMDRTTMAPDAGMLFVFDTIAPRTFWMKDTLLPLDIIYLDADLKVTQIYPSVEADQTTTLYPSDSPIKYGLETNAGWSAIVGLEKGDQIILK